MAKMAKRQTGQSTVDAINRLYKKRVSQQQKAADARRKALQEFFRKATSGGKRRYR